MSLKAVLRRYGGGTQNPPPIPDVPPFWVPIPEAELHRFGRETAFDAVAALAGWRPALFLLTTFHSGGGRITVAGYVRGAFGVYTCTIEGQNLAMLVHLPSGYAVSRSIEDDVILLIADALAGAVPDWQAATIEEITAASATFHGRIAPLGLRCIRIRIMGEELLVWVRKPQTVRDGGEVMS